MKTMTNHAAKIFNKIENRLGDDFSRILGAEIVDAIDQYMNDPFEEDDDDFEDDEDDYDDDNLFGSGSN